MTFHMWWESTVRDWPALFRMMERAERLGFLIKFTDLPHAQSKGYWDESEVLVNMYGDDMSSMAAFLQMLDAEGEMLLGESAKASMRNYINEGIDNAAERISWL